MSYYIGIIGSSFAPMFNKKKVCKAIDAGIKLALRKKEELEDEDFDDNIYIVSSLINEGITQLIYKEAKKRNLKTIGIGSEKSKHYELIPETTDSFFVKSDFDEKENEFFIRNLDILIIIGQGSRNREREAKKQNISVYRFPDILD